MNSNKKSHWLRTLLVTASAGLLLGSMAYFVPDADAGRGGRGSVRHSSKSGRSHAQPSRGGSRRGGSAQPSRGGTRRGGSARPSRGGTRRGGSAQPSRGGTRRGGSAQPSRGGTRRGGSAHPSRGGSRGAYRAGARHGRADARHSAWKDARRDYYRFRTVNHLIRAGTYLATRPTYSSVVVVGGSRYYYAGGYYYVARGSRYVVVDPPYGAVVHAVPTTATIVYVDTTPYYYYGGSYYVVTNEPAPAPEPPPDTNIEVNVNVTSQVTTEDGQTVDLPPLAEDDVEESFKVVSPPSGATVPYLPEEATKTTVNGKKYFVHNDTYYRPFASDGDTIYQVVEDPRAG